MLVSVTKLFLHCLFKMNTTAWAHLPNATLIDELIKDLVIRADVASRQVAAKSNTDTLVRSLIRHDSHKLATILLQLLEKEIL